MARLLFISQESLLWKLPVVQRKPCGGLPPHPPCKGPSSLLPFAPGAPGKPRLPTNEKIPPLSVSRDRPPETQGFVSSLSPAAAMMNRGSPGEPGAALPPGNLVINTDRGNSPEEIFKDQLEYSRLHSLSWELLKIYVGCMAQETWLVFSFALGKEKGLQIKPTNKL